MNTPHYGLPADITNAAIARANALPVPDHNDITHWCCVACLSEDVTWSDDMLPSGLRPKVTCSNGHTTNGMPVKRFRTGPGR